MPKINALSFMDGFLMARTMLGDTRGKALENWDTRLGELFEGLQDDYAQRKLNFTEAIVYTEDFVKTMPELESWFTGLAFVFLSDREYGRRLEALEHTEAGQIAWQFQAVFRGLMVAGPIARGHPAPPEDQHLLPEFKRAVDRFLAELRRYGLRKRLNYVGGILGMLSEVGRGLPEPKLSEPELSGPELSGATPQQQLEL